MTYIHTYKDICTTLYLYVHFCISASNVRSCVVIIKSLVTKLIVAMVNPIVHYRIQVPLMVTGIYDEEWIVVSFFMKQVLPQ